MVSPATLERRSRGTDSGPSRGEVRSSPPGHARRAGGRRPAGGLVMGAGSRRHPPITGNLPSTIPIIQLGRGGGDPKSLNVAVWGATSSSQALRGRVLHEKSRPPGMRGDQVRSALQEGNLGKERVLNPRYASPFRIRDAGEGRYPRSISPIRASYSNARSRRRLSVNGSAPFARRRQRSACSFRYSGVMAANVG